MVFRCLETIFNHLDGESSVGIPLVPKYRCTDERGMPYRFSRF